MSTLTTHFSFYQPAQGDGILNGHTWGLQVNANFELIDRLLWDLIHRPIGGTATTSARGMVRMATEPDDPDDPVAVGDNDPRLLYSYTLPMASSLVLGGVKVGTGLFIGEDGVLSTFGGGGGEGGAPWIPVTLTPPVPSGFTWVNQAANSAIATLQTGQTTFYLGSTTLNTISLKYTTYTGSKRCVAAFNIVSIMNTQAGGGFICVGDTSGKWIEFGLLTYGGYGNQPIIRIVRWNSPSSPNSETFVGSNTVATNSPLFFSIYDDGANLNFQISIDGGQNWDTLYSQARLAFLTSGPSRFGFGMAPSGASNLKQRTNFIHWSVS